jgi:hypothetical protein
MKTRCWIYKWNLDGKTHTDKTRDFRKLFLGKPTGGQHIGYGFYGKNPMVEQLFNQLREGDLLFCYQTATRTLEGIAILVTKAGQNERRHIVFSPAIRFEKPIPIHRLKVEYSNLKQVRALKRSWPRSLFDLSDSDRDALVEACESYESNLSARLRSLPCSE